MPDGMAQACDPTTPSIGYTARNKNPKRKIGWLFRPEAEFGERGYQRRGVCTWVRGYACVCVCGGKLDSMVDCTERRLISERAVTHVGCQGSWHAGYHWAGWRAGPTSVATARCASSMLPPEPGLGSATDCAQIAFAAKVIAI